MIWVFPAFIAVWTALVLVVLFVKRDAVRGALHEANEEFWHLSGIRKDLKRIADEQAAQRRNERNRDL